MQPKVNSHLAQNLLIFTRATTTSIRVIKAYQRQQDTYLFPTLGYSFGYTSEAGNRGNLS